MRARGRAPAAGSAARARSAGLPARPPGRAGADASARGYRDPGGRAAVLAAKTAAFAALTAFAAEPVSAGERVSGTDRVSSAERVSGAADDDPARGLPLPPGSRADDERPETFVSGRGFRESVSFYERVLRARGAGHRAVPVYRYRGVTLARFLAEDDASRWSAIHVYAIRQATYVAVIGPP